MSGLMHGGGLARRWRWPIAYRLALLFSLVTAGGMLVLGTLVARNQSQLLDEQMHQFAAGLTRQFAGALSDPLLAGDRLGIELQVSQLLQQARVTGAAVADADGNLLNQGGRLPPELDSVPISAQGVQRRDWNSGPGRPMSAFSAPVRHRDVVAGHVITTFDRSVLSEARARAIGTITAVTGVLVLLAIAASVWIGRRLAHPIRRLAEASRRIGEGDYSMRFDTSQRDEVGELMVAMNAMSEALERKEQVEQTFSRYVSPAVAEQILADLERVELGGHYAQASVMFADIVGFTSMSEELEPHEVSDLLNHYFSQIAQTAAHFQGHIDKYIGDCAMLVFGVPRDDPDHAYHAAGCALAVLEVVAELNRLRREHGEPAVEFRIGLNSGRVLAGNMGSPDRLEYTVVGDTVNLAARLAAVGESGEVIVTSLMLGAEGLGERLAVTDKGRIRIRGKKDPVTVYRIDGLHDAKDTATMRETVAAIIRELK